MKLCLLHLYHDLMDLYGERANVLLLERHLADIGFSVETVRASLGDTPDFDRADVVYTGGGTERAQKAALAHLRGFNREIGGFLARGGVMVATGNSFEMLGAKIVTPEQEYPGLGLFEFYTQESAERRLCGDVLYSCRLFEQKVIGFINKASELFEIDTPLFGVDAGLGNHDGSSYEGFTRGNLFATHLVGPALVRNPALAQCVVARVCDYKDFTPQAQPEYPLEQRAYETALAELTRRYAPQAR